MVALTWSQGPWHYRGTVSQGVHRNFAGADIGTTSKAGIGASYFLSKRTSVYANLAYTRNRHGAAAMPVGGLAQTAPNRGGLGREIGVRTSF